MSHVISEVSSRSDLPAMPRRRRAIGRMVAAAGRIARNEAFRRFALATPALLIGLGIPLALPLLQMDPGETRRLYEAVAGLARERGDVATARVCLDRLVLLKQRSGFVPFDFVGKLAKLALDLGQAERADVLLEEVAPEDRAVYAPAHFMRANYLLRRTGEGKEVPRADWLRAERHLRYALKLEPEMSAAHEILGQIALQSGDLDRAENHLQHAAKANPALSYQVAAVLHRQGRSQSATFWAGQARDYFGRLSEKEPDNHGARMLWASAETLLENHESARAILSRGLSRSNLREFHQLLANSYVLEAAMLAKGGNPDPAARLALLENALKHDPGNSNLIEQISDILKGNGLGAEQFRGRLQALLAKGQALITAHLLLGYDAWEHGRVGEAKLHWERALEADPKSSIVANNLAWALATGTDPDLPRALSLINLALDHNPIEPSLLSTRGRILARLGRWRESLSSLEAALPALPESRDLHADLAAVYAALNEPGLAEQHRRLAETPPKGPAR